ncbi:EAL domain-containing protein [Catenovulum sp. SM1970]|uniref:putative bifunctional diguanylate cyclase/phosphodiesterase n=1 Tax=Marinifaba aquimaris TaxID=2741323 RepID=UPI0015719469|nr:EAL domain-containing protein [Marinifaba aquimaris]NTS77730.1 EAL domain-containing protein [Marinifaba aquimaris]
MPALKFFQPYLLTILFFTTLSAITGILLSFDQAFEVQFSYVSFACLLTCSYFVDDITTKKLVAIIAYLLLLFIGIEYHLDIETIEEIYVFIPMLFIMIFPGSFWPILAAVGLLSAYVSSLSTSGFLEVMEDGLELVVINTFATVMVYFQQKTQNQMRMFRQESYTDYLTGLGNRKKFLELINAEHDLFKNLQGNGAFALLVIDLDGFKKVNDQLGHLLGDIALKRVAKRFETLASDNCTLYRLGGDEFTFILHKQHNIEEKAEQLAKNIIKVSEEPYIMEGKTFTLSASVGIAFYPNDANEIETLCTYADLAMYKAKMAGKNTYALYDPELTAKTLRTHDLEDDLKLAIAKNQLSLHYQPKVCLKTGQILSAEALLRWQHPKYGFVSPMEFIAIAEQNQLINELGDWALETAAKDICKWKQQFHINNVAVNVSSLQLADKHFPQRAIDLLNKLNCPAEWIEIEQTESGMMANRQENIRALNKLKELGFTLSLDDFGTAYSSLAHVSKLPINVLKIDKSFIDHCVTNNKDHMVVRTIIQLASNLGMKTIAEGVESEDQLKLLRKEGCDEYQGYYFSKPIPAKDFSELLEKQGN